MVELNFDFETQEEYNLFVLLTLPTLRRHLRGRIYSSTLKGGREITLKIMKGEKDDKLSKNGNY